MYFFQKISSGFKIIYFPFLCNYKIAGKSAETAGYRWQPAAVLNPLSYKVYLV
jgi:hypothetical protein